MMARFVSLVFVLLCWALRGSIGALQPWSSSLLFLGKRESSTRRSIPLLVATQQKQQQQSQKNKHQEKSVFQLHGSKFNPPSSSRRFHFQRGAEENDSDSDEQLSNDNKNDGGKQLDSFVSMVGSHTSIVVSGLFYAALVWKRNGFMAAFFLGSIGNAILGKILKKMIQQTRPPDMVVSALRLKPSDGGMPSSHAMSLGFIGTFILLHQPYWFVPIFILTATSLLYRVQVRLHSWDQIAVGLVVGSTNAMFYYTFAESSVIEFLNQTIMNKQGLLPYPFLIVPTVVGAAVVGSLERRISNWIQQRSKII